MKAVRSSVLVELDDDGIARHISHVRRVPEASDMERDSIALGDSDDSNSASDVEEPVY